MHVTNFNSNLTPVPRVISGAVPNTLGGVLVSKKCKGIKKHYRDDNNRGLSEHTCHFSTPYTCASTTF